MIYTWTDLTVALGGELSTTWPTCWSNTQFRWAQIKQAMVLESTLILGQLVGEKLKVTADCVLLSLSKKLSSHVLWFITITHSAGKNLPSSSNATEHNAQQLRYTTVFCCSLLSTFQHIHPYTHHSYFLLCFISRLSVDVKLFPLAFGNPHWFFSTKSKSSDLSIIFLSYFWLKTWVQFEMIIKSSSWLV